MAKPREVLDWVIARGYIKNIRGVYEIQPSFYEVMGKSSSNKDIRDLCEMYSQLWPKGVKSGGYYVRTGVSSLFKKMQKFVRNHPQYSFELILRATKKYIEEKRKENWYMIACSDNFIEKNDSSRLEGYCEAVLHGAEEQEEEVRGRIA